MPPTKGSHQPEQLHSHWRRISESNDRPTAAFVLRLIRLVTPVHIDGSLGVVEAVAAADVG